MPHVEARCIESDAEYKQLAAEYRRTSRAIKQCISECTCILNACENKCASQCPHWRYLRPLEYRHRINRCWKRTRVIHTTPAELQNRIKILNEMYRTTTAIGREAEHYYERDWWRSEVYTLNNRK